MINGFIAKLVIAPNISQQRNCEVMLSLIKGMGRMHLPLKVYTGTGI